METVRVFTLAICLTAALWAQSCVCYQDTPVPYEPTPVDYGTHDSYSDSSNPNYRPNSGDSYGNRPRYFNPKSYGTANPSSYGEDNPTYPPPSYDNPTYPPTSYDNPTYPPTSYDNPTYGDSYDNRPRYFNPKSYGTDNPSSYGNDNPTYPPTSYDNPTYPPTSYDNPTYPPTSYDNPTYGDSYGNRPRYFNPKSYGTDNPSSYGVDNPTYPLQSYDNPTYPPQSYDSPTYPPSSYDNRPRYFNPRNYGAQNAYGDSYPQPSYDNPTYPQPSYDNRPRTTLYPNPTPRPTRRPTPKPITPTPRPPTPTPSSQSLDYCRSSPSGSGGKVTSFGPREYSFIYNGQTIGAQGQVEAGRERFGITYSEDTSSLRKIGAIRSRVKLDFGGSRQLIAMKVYDSRRTACFVTSLQSCNVSFDELARIYYNYVFIIRRVHVPFTNALKYRVTGSISQSSLASTNPALARFCEEASAIYSIERGMETGPGVRTLRIFYEQGPVEIDVGNSYNY